MLNSVAFASSLAILSGVFYLVLFLLAAVSRGAFRFVFNAQFLGADVASLLPRELSYAAFLGTLMFLLITGWVFGFAWAWLYNRLSGVALK